MIVEPTRATRTARAPASAAATARPWPARALAGAGALALGFHQRRLLVVAVFLGIAAFPALRATDIDFWWHLETGELIARSAAIPTADPYSYTARGRPWVAHEWLWELLVYGLYRAGGYARLVAVSGVVVAATYAVLYRLLRRLGVNELVAAALVVWAAVLALPSVGVRPRELTHLFLALYLSLLLPHHLRHRERRESPASPEFPGRERLAWRLWALPPLMLLWSNLHGPFVLGLGLLGLVVAGETLEWLRGRGQPPRRLALVGLATLAASFANPAGPRMLLYPLDYYLQGDNPSFSSVTEFQSPNFHEPLYLAFAASLLLLTLLGRRRGDAVEALLLVAFALQALVSVRHVAVYALVAAPLLALRLRESWPLAGELPPPRPSARRAVANGLLLAALLALGVRSAAEPSVAARLQLRPEPSAATLPVAGARLIEERGLPDPVLNHQPWGGYLIWRWYPARRVFIDGRIDVYGRAIVDDYREVVSARPGWRGVLDRYGIRTVLAEKDSPLAVLLLADPDWERLYRGEVEEVFVRRGEPPVAGTPGGQP